MKLFLVHCGFYDTELCDGIYESHVNYFVAAANFDDAKIRAKQLPEFKAKRMHIDGLQEISAVSGHSIQLVENASLNGETVIVSNKHRDLAPPKPAPVLTV